MEGQQTLIKRALNEGRWVFSSPKVKQHIVGGSFLLIVLLLIGSMLYSTLSWMWDDQRLPLSKIVIQGDLKYVTTQDVQRVFSQLDHIGTFMSEDINTLQDTVQSIPWVEHASIRKQWPDTIKVFLTENVPVAVWNGTELLNDKGQVFHGDVSKLQQEHVKLYGPEGSSQEVLTTWQDIRTRFQHLGLNVSSLVLNERRAWQIILDNGIRLELGKESLDERIERFSFLYKKLGDKAEKISYVDLRYDTGAAVGWFPEEE